MTNVLGRIRKLNEGVDTSSPDVDAKLRVGVQLEALVTAGAVPYREITRLGRAFYVGTTTAVAAVVALPTTAVLLALYNGEPDGGRSYVIDWVSATAGAVVSGVASEAQLLVGQTQGRETVPTNSALVIQKCNGLGSFTDTRARTVINTTVPTAPSWIPVGPSGAKFNVVANTTSVGHGAFADLGGRFICPPGRYFCLTVIADATGETFQTAIGWHEVQHILG